MEGFRLYIERHVDDWNQLELKSRFGWIGANVSCL